MAGKPLKTLADQLWNNHGVVLVPTFDDGIEPGSVLYRHDWNNIDHIGRLKAAMPQDGLPPLEGPRPCMLADFNRLHEINLGAAITLVAAPAKAKAEFERAKDVAARFESPVTYSLDLLRLEDAIEAQPDTFWSKALGQKLKDKRTRIVYQAIRGKVSFMFRGTGGVGIDLQATRLGSLSDVGLSAGWKWRNEATLESKHELLLAVEYAHYNHRDKMFEVKKR